MTLLTLVNGLGGVISLPCFGTAQVFANGCRRQRRALLRAGVFCGGFADGLEGYDLKRLASVGMRLPDGGAALFDDRGVVENGHEFDGEGADVGVDDGVMGRS